MLTAAPGKKISAHKPDLVAWVVFWLEPYLHFILVTQRRLFLYLGAALLLHLVLLGLVRIDTTRHLPVRGIRPLATLEIPTSTHLPQPLTTDYWDQLSDPRLFLVPALPLTSSAPPNFLSDFTSSPAQTSSPLPLAAAPKYALLHPNLESLGSRLQGTLLPGKTPFTYEVPALHMQTTSTWLWGDSLALRAPLTAPVLPSPVSNTLLSSTKIRMAVEASGTVRDAVLEQSCGKPELDQMALTAARKIRFQALPASLLTSNTTPPAAPPAVTWGTVSLSWYTSPEPQEQVVPTPPTGN